MDDSPLLLSKTTSPRTMVEPSTSSFCAGAPEVSLYDEMSPTATLPEGPWTKTRPTTEKFGRVIVVLTSRWVTSPAAASTPAPSVAVEGGDGDIVKWSGWMSMMGGTFGSMGGLPRRSEAIPSSDRLFKTAVTKGR